MIQTGEKRNEKREKESRCLIFINNRTRSERARKRVNCEFVF